MLAQSTRCLNCSCENGQTPLLNAIEGGHLQTFKLLLDSDADPKFRVTEVQEQVREREGGIAGYGGGGATDQVLARGKTDSTLFRAAKCGELDMTRILADRGVALDEGDRKNLSNPLIVAIEEGHAEIVRVLVEYV